MLDDAEECELVTDILFFCRRSARCLSKDSDPSVDIRALIIGASMCSCSQESNLIFKAMMAIEIPTLQFLERHANAMYNAR